MAEKQGVSKGFFFFTERATEPYKRARHHCLPCVPAVLDHRLSISVPFFRWELSRKREKQSLQGSKGVRAMPLFDRTKTSRADRDNERGGGVRRVFFL